MISSRHLAADALLRVGEGGYSQLVFDSLAKKAALPARDTQFAAALFYGVLERQVTLDHCIAHYARHKLKPPVQVALREAFYQLLYLDGVPEHAAVAEAVDLVRKLGQPAAAGMVNGILRSFLRDKKAIPPVKGKAAKRLSVEGSCCEGLAKCLIGWYGEETAAKVLAATFGRPPLYLRVNTVKITEDELIARLAAEGCECEKSGNLKNCLVAKGDPVRTAAHAEGLFHLQDLCSQQAAMALGAVAGERVLDVCAAPGSKSFTIAEEMENKGAVLSCDAARKRLAKVREGAKRLSLTIIDTLPNDGSVINEELGEFDRVLCDVPCSGLGVLRRKPEIKLRGEESFKDLPELQYKILSTSANYLKTGGVLVYSTCTVNPEENEKIVEKFLSKHENFSPLEKDGWAIKLNLPGEDGGDGFFIARMRRDR